MAVPYVEDLDKDIISRLPIKSIYKVQVLSVYFANRIDKALWKLKFSYISKVEVDNYEVLYYYLGTDIKLLLRKSIAIGSLPLTRDIYKTHPFYDFEDKYLLEAIKQQKEDLITFFLENGANISYNRFLPMRIAPTKRIAELLRSKYYNSKISQRYSNFLI